MRKVGEILRLKCTTKLSHADIARSAGVGKTTVTDVLKRAGTRGISWPYPEGMTDEIVESVLYSTTAQGNGRRPLPDFKAVHETLTKDKGATLLTCWDEYVAFYKGNTAYEKPYAYTRFTMMYRKWKKENTSSERAVMRFVGEHEHKGGERCYVDYSGLTIMITDKETGKKTKAQVFVGVIALSAIIYCEATMTQSLTDWIGSHVRMYEYFGGVPAITIPDNLKSAVHKPHRYEPDLNPTYHEFAVYYNTAVLPARVRKPRDKAAVEVAVQIIQRQILYKLRKVTFFTLSEANEAIRGLLKEVNNKPMQKKEGSRHERFLELDKPYLQPLPRAPFDCAVWKNVTVHPDYHVSIDSRYYSVPFELIGKEVNARVTRESIEILFDGKRVAAHSVSSRKYSYTTNPTHRPRHHSELGKWTPERLIKWGERIGPDVGEFIAISLERKYPHPEQGFRAAQGLLGLERAYGAERLNQACKRAVHYDKMSSKVVKEMLKHGLDKKPIERTSKPKQAIITHRNLREKGFFK